MAKYVIRFMPEYTAPSLWPVNRAAHADFGIPIHYDQVGLSDALTKKLEAFDHKIMGIIDWNDPAGKSPMTPEERKALYQEGKRLMQETIQELGEDFEVIDELDWIKGEENR